MIVNAAPNIEYIGGSAVLGQAPQRTRVRGSTVRDTHRIGFRARRALCEYRVAQEGMGNVNELVNRGLRNNEVGSWVDHK